MKRILSLFNPLRLTGFAFLCVVAAGVALYVVFFAKPHVEIYTLKLSTGRELKTPKRITTFFKDNAARQGLEIKQVFTNGSEDSLDKVEAGTIDLAVIKGGIRLGNRTNVVQVTALDLESFHLLVKDAKEPDKKSSKPKDAKGAKEAKDEFADLRGKTINVNLKTTGTYHWSIDILDFAGLKLPSDGVKGDFTPKMLGTSALEELTGPGDVSVSERMRRQAQLPDAILLADPVPSPTAKMLITKAGYRLVPLDFGPAYVQARHAADPHPTLDMDVLIETPTIPAFTYSVSPAVPAEPCPTIGLRRLLVANKNVPPEAIVRVLHLLYDGPPDHALNFLDWDKVRPQYPVHDGVPQYDFQRKQVLQNTVVKLLEKLASVLGGVIAGVLGIYGFFKYRRLLRFEHYFREIRLIDLVARGKHFDPRAPTDRADLLVYLQNQLADLRAAAIAEFARGRLQGESLILSIFTLIRDTSANLPTLLGPKGTLTIDN